MKKILALVLLLSACTAQVEAPTTSHKAPNAPVDNFENYPNQNIPDPSNCPPPVTFNIVKDGVVKECTFTPPCLGPVAEDPFHHGDPPFSHESTFDRNGSIVSPVPIVINNPTFLRQ